MAIFQEGIVFCFLRSACHLKFAHHYRFITYFGHMVLLRYGVTKVSCHVYFFYKKFVSCLISLKVTWKKFKKQLKMRIYYKDKQT